MESPKAVCISNLPFGTQLNQMVALVSEEDLQVHAHRPRAFISGPSAQWRESKKTELKSLGLSQSASNLADVTALEKPSMFQVENYLLAEESDMELLVQVF